MREVGVGEVRGGDQQLALQRIHTSRLPNTQAMIRPALGGSNVAAGGSFITAWVDFDISGTFEDGERILIGEKVTTDSPLLLTPSRRLSKAFIYEPSANRVRTLSWETIRLPISPKFSLPPV